MIIEYCRIRENVKHPERANPSDAGLDVFFCPKNDESYLISPNYNQIMPTGLKFAVPHGYMLQAMNRSSMAAKRGLVVGAHCIDSGYVGEIFIDLHNIGSATEYVEKGTKIAQLVLTPVIHFRPQETAAETLYNEYPMTISDRGDGSLGSTG